MFIWFTGAFCIPMPDPIGVAPKGVAGCWGAFIWLLAPPIAPNPPLGLDAGAELPKENPPCCTAGAAGPGIAAGAGVPKPVFPVCGVCPNWNPPLWGGRGVPAGAGAGMGAGAGAEA